MRLLPLQTMLLHSHSQKHIQLGKAGIKVIYGVEANLVNDGVPIAYNEAHRLLAEETYVVFDVETTGLSAVYDTVIELAVKVKGEIIDRFESLQIRTNHYRQRSLN